MEDESGEQVEKAAQRICAAQ